MIIWFVEKTDWTKPLKKQNSPDHISNCCDRSWLQVKQTNERFLTDCIKEKSVASVWRALNLHSLWWTAGGDRLEGKSGQEETAKPGAWLPKYSTGDIFLDCFIKSMHLPEACM